MLSIILHELQLKGIKIYKNEKCVNKKKFDTALHTNIILFRFFFLIHSCQYLRQAST